MDLRPTLGLACATLTLAAGCGGSAGDSDPPVDGPWGSLDSGVDLHPDTPKREVARYLGRLQTGATPQALGQYVPVVREAIGLRRLATALEQVAASRVAGGWSTRALAPEAATARVVVTVEAGGGEPARYDFTLVRRRDRWTVAYDDLTADSLAGWAAVRSGGVESSRGKAAGRRARRAFKAAGARALPGEGRP